MLGRIHSNYVTEVNKYLELDFPFDLERDLDLESRLFERERERESRFKERDLDLDLDFELSRDLFERERVRDFNGDLEAFLDFERLRDLERLRDERRERERERLRERDLERLLDDRERPRPLPPPLRRRSSTKRTLRPFNSVSSNFSIAVFISASVANSTTL